MIDKFVQFNRFWHKMFYSLTDKRVNLTLGLLIELKLGYRKVTQLIVSEQSWIRLASRVETEKFPCLGKKNL